MRAPGPWALRAMGFVALGLVVVGCGRTDARTGLSAEREALVLKGAEVCSAVRLTNHGPAAVSIRDVLLNGEQPAVMAEKSSQRYGPSGKPLPASLDAGDSVLLFHRDLETRPAENYAKDLSFLLVDTPDQPLRVPVTAAAAP